MTVPESGLRVLTVPRPWSSCESPVRACTSNRVLEDSTWRRCSIVMPKILALHERRNLLQRLLRDRRHHRVARRIAHDQNKEGALVDRPAKEVVQESHRTRSVSERHQTGMVYGGDQNAGGDTD